MALVDSVVSVSLLVDEIPDGFILVGMRGGFHFDVVFSGEQKAEAEHSIVAWLRTLAALHQGAAETEERTPPNAQDVYVQLRVVGTWMERTQVLRSGLETKRLFIQTTGWSFQGIDGVEQAHGSIAPAAVGVDA
jgi:hypothetical protein